MTTHVVNSPARLLDVGFYKLEDGRVYAPIFLGYQDLRFIEGDRLVFSLIIGDANGIELLQSGNPATTEILYSDVDDGLGGGNTPALFVTSASVQWLRDGVDIPSASNPDYFLTQEDVGTVISMRYSFVDEDGFVEILTLIGHPYYYKPILNFNDLPVGDVIISGLVKEGETLRLSSTVTDKDGIDTSSIAYSWLRDGKVISGAVGDSYALTQADAGTQIIGVQTYTDMFGNDHEVQSAPTALVINDLEIPLILYGTNRDDTISGENGADRLYGRGGYDIVNGGLGNDRLYGDSGDDTLNGQDGNDDLYGGYDDDLLRGGEGDDRLYGEAGDDRLQGGNGNDLLYGGLGADLMIGGAGDDTYYVDDPGDRIRDGGLSTDNDRVIVLEAITYTLGALIANASLADDSGSAGLVGNKLSNELTGNNYDNTLLGGAGDDILYSADGDDVVDGGAGDDLIIGGSGKGDDVYRGGKGRDTVKYTSATDDINVDLRAGFARSDGPADFAGIGIDKLTSIENVIGGSFSDTLIGSSVSNVLLGKGGKDKINGLGGNDILSGGKGKDRIEGGAGNDRLDGGNGNDNLDGGKGDDNLDGGKGDDYLEGKKGTDQLYGKAGNDSLIGGNGKDYLNGGNGNDVLTGGAGADTFYFQKGSGVDTITDFEDGVDLIKIGNGANGMGGLNFTTSGDNVIVTFSNAEITVQNITVAELDNSDNFIF